MNPPPSVFVVQHLHVHNTGEECLKMIGVYESRQAAEDATARLATQPGFREFPKILDGNSSENAGDNGFYIDRYEIGKDHWTEGFGFPPTDVP